VVRVSEQPEFNPAELPVTEVPIVPDHTKSREGKKPLFAGDRAEGTPRERAAAAKARTKAKTPLPVAATKPGYFIEPIQQGYAFMAMILMPFDPVCANAIMMQAPACAESLDNLASKNEATRRLLFALLQTSALGLVVAAHTPIMMAIMMHHSTVAQNLMGKMGQEMAEKIAEQMQQSQGENPGD
jgi:hypothetical protein